MHADLTLGEREEGGRKIRRKTKTKAERDNIALKALRAAPRWLKANAIATIRVSAEAVKEL